MNKHMSKEINVSYRSMTSEIRKVDEESRTITFVASDDTKDSAGTVLNQDNWDLRRFNSNGVIGYQHKVYGGWDDTDNPDNVIGKGVAYIEDKKLMVDITFEPADINPLADKIYKKIQFGSLRAVSVGFLPIGRGKFGEGEDSETYYFAGQELLEVSVVNIPANPNALKKSLFPILRILLAPARLRKLKRIFLCHNIMDRSFRIHKQELHCGSAEVDSDIL